MSQIRIVYTARTSGQILDETISGHKVGYEVRDSVLSAWANTLDGNHNQTVIIPLTSLGLIQVDIQK